jgi:CubicO group peptidase (beta-lactamase class C family)
VNADFNDPRVAQKWESGGGGMLSTAIDYARFCQMLLNGGTLDGKRILGPKTAAYMTTDHLGSAIATTPLYLPGAGGTYFWVDPKEDLFVVFMMQSPKQRAPYRGLLKDMIYAAITRPAGK